MQNFKPLLPWVDGDPLISDGFGYAPSRDFDPVSGRARAACTGAAGIRFGYFEDAGEGALFRGEIGELPQEPRLKLLRIGETRTPVWSRR